LPFIIFYSIPPSPLAVARATLAVARARHGQALAVKAQTGGTGRLKPSPFEGEGKITTIN